MPAASPPRLFRAAPCLPLLPRLLGPLTALALATCSAPATTAPSPAEPDPVVHDVLSEQGQHDMTVEQAVQRLRDGNQRFVSGHMLHRDLHAQVEAAAEGQHPFAAVLSCIDSRVPVELVFDQGIGDVFSARVAGNVVDDDIAGSLEYAASVVGSKLIVVLGHGSCGAVKGACANVQVGHIKDVVNLVKPSVAAVAGPSCDAHDHGIIDRIAAHNVGRMVGELRVRSEVLRTLEAEGKVKLVGAMYDIHTGRVVFLP